MIPGDLGALELRHLRAFIAVAESEHVTRAAERLHIAQPALSRQIQQLETILGAPLFARVGRGVRLTEAGRALLEDARSILDSVSTAAQHAREVAHGRAGVLRVGFVEVASASGLVPEAVRRFAAAHPGVTVDLRELTSSAQLAALESGELDVGMVCGLAAARAGIVRAHTLLADPLVAVLRAGHPLATTRRLNVRALATQRLLMVKRTLMAGLTGEVESAFARNGVPMPEVQEVSQMHTAVHLAAAGIGIGIVPRSVAVTSAGVEVRPIAGVDVVHRTQLIVAPQHRTPALDAFSEICETVGRELAALRCTAPAPKRPRTRRSLVRQPAASAPRRSRLA